MKSIERSIPLFVVAMVAVLAPGAIGCGGALNGPTTGTGGSPGAAGTTGDDGSAAPGGTTGTGGVSGPGGAGGAPAVCTPPHGGEVPSEHRATAPACAASTPPPLPDGGIPPACTTNADCTATSRGDFYQTCFHGQCSYDGCLTDTDCGSTGVCACSSDYYGGNGGYHPNVCVPANCRLDSDCGAGGYCSPSRGYCGTFQGFYCHTPADSCVNPTVDCATCGQNACTYSPATAAFTCGSSVCAG
jgi:hypothetical protein